MLQVTPTSWIDSRLLVKAQTDIWKTIAAISDGEVIYQHLDAVGKYLFEAPTRLGGQNWHNLLREAPLCFIGNVGSHGHVVFKKLQNLDKNLDGKISTAAEENGQESTSDEEKWIIGVQRTLEEAKTSLKLCDMAGAVAKNGLDLLFKAGNARKGDVLTKWQDALQQNMKTALDT